MKNKINYGTPQHNNDKDKKCTNNSQKDPGVSGDLARPTALSLAPHALLTASNKHTRSANVPVINQLQKPFLNYTVVQNMQLHDKVNFLLTKSSSNCFW